MKSKASLIMLNISLLLVAVLTGAIVLLLSIKAPQPTALLTEVTVEAGSQTIDPGLFLADTSYPAPVLVTELTPVQLSTPGEYAVALVFEEKTYGAIVHVRDTIAPQGTLRNLSTLGEMPDAEEFLVEAVDFTEVTVTYEALPDMTLPGDQQVRLVLTDTSGNRTVLEAVLSLDLDVTAPEISGVQDILVYQGSAVAYRSGITVTDDRDAAPALSVDASGVNLSQPGEYTVVYTATDSAGNMARQEATVTVMEKKPGYVELEVVYSEVDKLLESIITEGMTAREQAWAIYKWIRNNCSYDNHADIDDVHQAAYIMLTQRKGDCFYYYSLSKLMMDRIGIPNLDVQKVKNYPSDSNHYWSLVSVDGGQTWYHFDTTPRDQTGFFLVTDAFMDAYSAQHQNCFNRDKSLYPPTPES